MIRYTQWQILDLGQNVENFKPLNFRSGTFYNKVYEMKYLQNTNRYIFLFLYFIILMYVIKDKTKNMKDLSGPDDSLTKFLINISSNFC